MTTQPDFKTFFDDYAAAFDRSLGATVDKAAITGAFAPCFVGAGPKGVNCGKNDAEFGAGLETGYRFYKEIGTERMSIRGLDVTAIDDLHHMVTVHWRAEYKRRKDGQHVTIDFDGTYILQTLKDQQPKIFAYISGDEMDEYKKHGLV
jgi:hypothetical protein